jgi:hypothetical protein
MAASLVGQLALGVKADLEHLRADLRVGATKAGDEAGKTLGARIREILGLAWADLDDGRIVATIPNQLAGSRPRATRVQLKTAASEKPVPLPPFVTSRLIAHHAAQLRGRFAAGVPTDEGLVFVTPRGLPVSHSWLTQHFQDLLRAAGLPKMISTTCATVPPPCYSAPASTRGSHSSCSGTPHPRRRPRSTAMSPPRRSGRQRRCWRRRWWGDATDAALVVPYHGRRQ